MKAAVWDTYVQLTNGNTLHFDVVVPDTITDAAIIYSYAKNYLNQKKIEDAIINTENCQFCHIEALDDEMKTAIDKNGFHIIEMEEIPSVLPENANRRDYILHLRAHYAIYRYADFRGKTEDEIKQLFLAQQHR